MLELLGSSLFSIWLEMAKVQIQPLEALSLLAWQGSSSLILVPDPSPAGAITVQEYLHGLITSKLIDQNLLSWIG